jgi:hypothetical protein
MRRERRHQRISRNLAPLAIHLKQPADQPRNLIVWNRRQGSVDVELAALVLFDRRNIKKVAPVQKKERGDAADGEPIREESIPRGHILA